MRGALMGVATALLLVLAAAASGDAFKTQAKTASAHASFAADGSSMSYVKEHLGHTLVCIEGEKGKNVHPAWENVCKGQGNGVLNDLRASKDGAAWIPVAEAADALAVSAMKSTNLAQIKTSARGVSELMRLIAEAK